METTMRRVGCLLFLAILAATFATAQTTSGTTTPGQPVKKNPLAPYAGIWTATIDGKAWLTVQLALNGEQLTGSVQYPHDLKFADSGEVQSVSEGPLNAVVEKAEINGDGLLLNVKNPETQENNRFAMRLTGDTTAEMKMVAMAMPPGMAKPKPWKLNRVVSMAAPAAH
jgi:hypothetical protein